MNALETYGLGRRYGRRWALQDCTLAVPCGRVVGLVGPNGAGKSTLLHMAVGLLAPSVGEIRVLGGQPPRERPGQLGRIGFVGQDKPLYRRFRVGEMLGFGALLNPTWDQEWAARRIDELGIPLEQRIGELSGGQHAQVALALALGKRPELLALDEPVANLDPLARREFLQMLMAEVADSAVSVILSSHLIADLERVCDYLTLLSNGRVRLAGDTDELLATHRMFIGAREQAESLGHVHSVVSASYTDRQATLMVRLSGRSLQDATWKVRPITLEELVLGYMTSHPERQNGSTVRLVHEVCA
ncbi:MAG: ABC transporter ATP-binding protein [Acidimicrobiales bacterium]